MIQRDYILRLTQQIAQVVAKLLGKSTEEKLEIIDQAFTEWLRLDHEELAQVDEEKIVDFLLQEKGFNVYQLELIAELMARHGEAFFEKQEFSSAKDQLKKSLIIFGFVEEETKLYSIERINTINHANDLLATILSHDQT